MECAVTWNDTRHLSKHLSHSAPTNNIEDGYRSPAYAATLELLSPSAELITKKKKMLGSSRAINLVLPSSASTQRRTHLVVSIVSKNFDIIFMLADYRHQAAFVRYGVFI
jgi:hypothetical protein